VTAPLVAQSFRDVHLAPAAWNADEWQLRLGAHAEDGSYLDAFTLRRWLLESKPLPAPSPGERRAAVRLPGRYRYGGIMLGHFGHFLLETLARAWSLRGDTSGDAAPILWHGTFGQGLSAWQQEVFVMLGLDTSRFHLVHAPTVVEEIEVADAGFRLGQFLHPAQVEALGVYPFGEPVPGRRIWLSRSDLRTTIGMVVGETLLEGILRDDGWTVVHPEALTVREQLDAMSRAEVIAGMEGSALHTLILGSGVRARVAIVPRTPGPRSPNFELIAEAKGIDQRVLRSTIVPVTAQGRIGVNRLRSVGALARQLAAV
jgi:capsular polysaccharide biosynthesis protein